MEIKLARYAGFCFGVSRAVKTVEDLAAGRGATERIYTLGKLIHNPHVVSRLEEAGVRVIDEKELPEICASATEASPVRVIIRTHGAPKEITDLLTQAAESNPSLRFTDCTCPYVRKIHEIVERETDQDTVLVVIGDPNHPEVKSIVSHAASASLVFSKAEDIDLSKLHNKKCVIVAQTTQKLGEWNKCQEILKKHCTNSKIFDTICSVTENRQTETDKLAQTVDLMVVIGGRESSNTKGLLATARKHLSNCVLIENAAELDPELVKKAQTVGITAGASTPGDIIEEVKKTMSEIMETSENFEAMLEESLKTLNTGDIVKGVITSISSTEVHVDLSANVTGVIPADELTGSDFKVGDEIEAYVVRVSDIEGVAGLSRKKIEQIGDWKKIVEASAEGTVLEGKVTETVKGGVMIALGAVKAFVPASQTGVPKDGDLKAMVGNTYKCVIIEINEGRKRAVASIKTVQRKERKEAIAKFWETIEVGQKFSGKVKSITSYGAFVDLGGVDGMVHISELSWSRIKNPTEVVSIGDTLDVFVKAVDADKKRISLGYKTEESNPWHIFTSNYAEGDVVSVTIANLTPFGAFARIIPEIDGLIHISQLSDRRVGAPAEVVKVGDVVDAKIIGIDNENQKVSLSIRALLEDNGEDEEDYDAE